MPQSTLRLGTRGSRLALAQAEGVRAALSVGGVVCDIVLIRTTGDRITDRPLAEAGGKGLFTKELEEALLDGRIDLAVHSMKDVPVLLPVGLEIAAVLPREDPRDCFISTKGVSLAAMPTGARIGTSSVRRQAQVARARPDVEVVCLRGNVDTRLAKLEAGAVDAIVLAYAGLKRLRLEDRATAVLATDDWLPALSQGAIGIEVCQNNPASAEVKKLNDLSTAVALSCERAFQQALDGSCTTPIAGLAQFSDGILRFRGEVLSPDGRGFVETSFEYRLGDDPKTDAAGRGREAGLELRPRAAEWLP